MSALVLSMEQYAAIRRAVQFWADRWDWESPTLFGLSKAEFSAAARAEVAARQTGHRFYLAALGALRELLHGGNAVPAAKISSVLGLTKCEAVSLMAVVSELLDGEI